MESDAKISQSNQSVESSIPPWKQEHPKVMEVKEMAQEKVPGEPKLASVVYRYAAIMVDGLIIGLFLLPFFVIAKISGFDGADKIVNDYGGLLVVLYSVYLIKTKHATWGKMYFKLQVETVDGSEITWWKAILREFFGKILSGIILSLGYFWAIWDKKKQAWHDKIAGTIVLQTEELGKWRKFVAYFLAFGLVILGILGILAVVVLAAINPQKQLEKAREQQTLYEQKLFIPGNDDRTQQPPFTNDSKGSI